MPKRDFYSGLTLAEAIRQFAEFHFQADQRHISIFEYEMLTEVAETLTALNRRCA